MSRKNLEQQRIYYLHNTREDLKKVERNINKQKEHYKIISQTTLVEKAQAILDKIGNLEEEQEKLENKIRDISTGKHDNEIISSLRSEGNTMRQKCTDTRQKKREIREDNAQRLKQLYAKPSTKYLERRHQKDMDYFLKRFHQIGDSLPNYMLKNLSTMPNNKGYIWKGCWFMGRKKSEKNQPQFMFEKCRDNVLKIHEYNQYEYKLYEKKGKNKRKHIHTKRKRVVAQTGIR